MAGVFISYRREDTPAHAGRVYEQLAARYGKHRVFRDLDAIPFATDFRQKINEAIGSCDAVIALIGRDWLTASDASGRPKLHNPKDWLRVEIVTALAKQKLVIPVLVENADMPSEDALPDPLKPLAYLHALKTTEQDWDHHVGLLIRTIEDNTDLRPGDVRTTAAYALMIAGIAARIIGGLRPIREEEWFVSADLAFIAVVAVVLALLARRPRARLLAAGLVVGAGIGTVLRFGQSLIGSNLQFGQSLAGPGGGAIEPSTLALYYVGLAGGLLLVVGGTVLYLATPRVGLRPVTFAALLGFLGVVVLVISIVASSDQLFVIRATHSPAVVPVGLAVVTLVGLIAMLSSPGFGPMGTGFLIVFGIQAILRYAHDLGAAKAGGGTWIGLAGGALILAAGLLGILQYGRTRHAA
jgi:TIR domain-containing protein